MGTVPPHPQSPLRLLQVDARTGKYHTYRDVCRAVPRIKAGMADAGVRMGDVLLLVTPNHIDFPLVLLATVLGGAVCVPVSPTLKPGEGREGGRQGRDRRGRENGEGE